MHDIAHTTPSYNEITILVPLDLLFPCILIKKKLAFLFLVLMKVTVYVKDPLLILYLIIKINQLSV